MKQGDLSHLTTRVVGLEYLVQLLWAFQFKEAADPVSVFQRYAEDMRQRIESVRFPSDLESSSIALEEYLSAFFQQTARMLAKARPQPPQ